MKPEDVPPTITVVLVSVFGSDRKIDLTAKWSFGHAEQDGYLSHRK